MSPAFWGNRRIFGRCPVCGSKRLGLTRGPLGEQRAVCLDCERDEQVRQLAQGKS